MIPGFAQEVEMRHSIVLGLLVTILGTLGLAGCGPDPASAPVATAAQPAVQAAEATSVPPTALPAASRPDATDARPAQRQRPQSHPRRRPRRHPRPRRPPHSPPRPRRCQPTRQPCASRHKKCSAAWTGRWALPTPATAAAASLSSRKPGGSRSCAVDRWRRSPSWTSPTGWAPVARTGPARPGLSPEL
jgi:hypothetical protein